MQLFGLMGSVKGINPKKQEVKVAFNKKEEQEKVHDPFLGQQIIKNV